MVGERRTGDIAEAAVLAGAREAWERLHERIAHRFRRVEVRVRVRRYLASLFARIERKNGWQLAEAMGELGPQGVQRLLRTARWSEDAVRDDLRAYVVEHLGDTSSGVLIIDETSFPKQGVQSCGVAPQYCGTLGQTANAQVGVFLAYASARGTACIDRALYLPRMWTKNHQRCTAAGVPRTVGFATKAVLAKQVLERAFVAGVPARWVVADSFYGRAHHFRHWLEQRGRAHVVGILPTQVVVHDGRRQRATALAASLPQTAWISRSSGVGSQGERVHAWACVALMENAAPGMQHWLLVRRSLEQTDDRAYFRAYGRVDTPVTELVRVAGARWSIEEAFAQAKGEVGLDQYEVRRWDGWHRHITLCLLAHAYLVVVTAQAQDAQQCGQTPAEQGTVSLLPLTVPEVRRLVQAMEASDEERAFRLGWSRWRRAHQAQAQRCHWVRRWRTIGWQAVPAVVEAPQCVALTDTEWMKIWWLLPPQKPIVGQPRHDHRTIVSGILWVLRTASPWREMPAQYGTWDTAYARYRLWRAAGLWQRIIDALGSHVAPPIPPPKP